MIARTPEAQAALDRCTPFFIGRNWLPWLETLNRIQLENELSRHWRRYEQNDGYGYEPFITRASDAHQLCAIVCGVRDRRFPKAADSDRRAA